MRIHAATAVVFAAIFAAAMSTPPAAASPAGAALAAGQAGATQAAHISGVLRHQDGHYLLDDEKTGKTIEVQGKGLDKYVGKRVEINGSTLPHATPAAGATAVVRVASIKTVAGTAAGLGLGTKVAIGAAIAGGAATGTVIAVREKEPVSR